MTEPVTISIPLINPNEPMALLAELKIIPGQHVDVGDPICTLETTKSTMEISAERSGYIVGLTCQVGQTIQAGDVLCYIADSADWSPPQLVEQGETVGSLPPGGMRISQPALLLAQRHDLDLTQLPTNTFITEKIVQEFVDTKSKAIAVLENQTYAPNSILVFGGGGHGKALIDLIRVLGKYSIAGIVDDGIPVGTIIMDVPVLGGSDALDHLYECGIHLAANAVGGIGNITTRIKVFERLAQVGFTCPTLQHPTSFVESSAVLLEGVQVMPNAYVGSEAQVGFGVIINTGAIVSHDCLLGDYVNLSPGAILAGEVNVGSASLVGMGVTVNLRVKIGSRVRVGNGATVKQDIPESGIVHAGAVWPSE